MDFELRKGQATLWIILGLVLVAVVVLLFMFRGVVDDPYVPATTEPVTDVNSYLRNCIGEEVERITEVILPQGGFMNPENYRLYNRTTVEYICETRSYFEPCINQHPMLIKELEEEIEAEIEPGVGACIRELERYVRDRGGIATISQSGLGINVELEYDRVLISLDKDITIEYKDRLDEFENFDFGVTSSIYNLAIIAHEISNQEATYCYFESAGYSLANPRYKIVRKMLSDQAKIYIIRDKKLLETMMIAIKSCPLPEGMPG